MTPARRTWPWPAYDPRSDVRASEWAAIGMDVSVGEDLADWAARSLDEEVVTAPGGGPSRASVRDLDSAARRLAASLRARGIGPGRLVLAQLPPSLAAVATAWGCAYAGAPWALMPLTLDTTDVRHVVTLADPAVVITAEKWGGSILSLMWWEVLGDLDALWFIDSATKDALPVTSLPFESLFQGPPIVTPPPVDPDEPAVLELLLGHAGLEVLVYTHRTARAAIGSAAASGGETSNRGSRLLQVLRPVGCSQL